MYTFTEEMSRRIERRRANFIKQEAHLQGFSYNDYMEDVAKGANGQGGRAALKHNQSIPTNLWVTIDEQNPTEIFRDELMVAESLRDREITIPSHTSEYRWPVMSESSDEDGDVVTSVDGDTRPNLDQAVMEYRQITVPFVTSGWKIGWAEYAQGVADGNNTIGQTSQRNALRKHAEKVENILLTGDTNTSVNGTVLTGLLNAPESQNVTKSAGVSAINGATGAVIFKEVRKLKEAIRNRKRKGQRYTLYMHGDDWDYCQDSDYSTEYPNKTIGQRVREIAGIDEVVPVYNSNLAESQMALIVKQDVQLISRMGMAVVPKVRHDEMDAYRFEIWGSTGLAVKADINGNAGVQRYNKA